MTAGSVMRQSLQISPVSSSISIDGATPSTASAEYAVDGLLRLSVEREDRAQLGLTGEHQFQTIFFGRVVGLLMGPNIAGG